MGLAEPRIEPEIIFKLALAPAPGMDETALQACIDWVGHDFEIVQSIFKGQLPRISFVAHACYYHRFHSHRSYQLRLTTANCWKSQYAERRINK